MELDTLKNSWKTISVDVDQSEFDIISTTRKEIESPLERLKKRTKKQLMILPALFIFLIVVANTMTDNDHFLIWMALVILPFLMIYYYFNLKLINKLEGYNGSVKNDMETKITKLIKSNTLYLVTTRILFLLLIITCELLLRYNRLDLIQGLELISTISFPVRLFIYAGIFGLHYLISRCTFNLYFGKYIKQLKKVLSEMQ